MIIFLAFSAILVTLVLQGLSLPRSFGRSVSPASPHHVPPEDRNARRTILEAALRYLDQTRETAKRELVEIYDDLS